MQLPVGYHHLSRNRSGELFQFGTRSSFFCFLFAHRSAMSNSTTSSTVKELSQKTLFLAWWLICKLSYWLKSTAKPQRDLPLNLNIIGHVCLILLPLHEWGLRTLIASLPLLLFSPVPRSLFPFSPSSLSSCLYTTTTTLCLSLCLSSTWLPVLLI